MKNKSEMAQRIIVTMGGKENISNVFHCMTRLRFNLKDNGSSNLDKTKEIEGVVGVQVCSGEIQVIIGPAVETVFNEVLKITGLTKTSRIDEVLDEPLQRAKPTFKSIGNAILHVFSACISPLIPLFVVIGIFNMIAVLIGPEFLNLVGETSDIYKNFYYVSQAILYFLPFMIAYTASKHFQCNTLITLAIVSFMLYPGMTEVISKGSAFTIFGAPMPLVDYSNSLIPMILIPWVQSYLERYLNTYVPDVIKVIVIPCGTMLIMLLLGCCILGPIGNYIGIWLGQFITWLYQVAGPLETSLMGALCVFSIVFGFTKPIFFICVTTLMTTGVEYTFLPIAMVISNWVMLGALLGYILSEHSLTKRQFSITCFVSLLLGGVSEPAVFGVFLNNKNSLIATAIAGAVSGLYLGIFKVGYYVFGPSSFLNVMGFVGGPSSNFMHGCIASAIAFIGAFILMLMLQKRRTQCTMQISHIINNQIRRNFYE